MTDETIKIPRKRIVRMGSSTKIAEQELRLAAFDIRTVTIRKAIRDIAEGMFKGGLITVTEREIPSLAAREIAVSVTVIVPGKETEDLRDEVMEAVKEERERIIGRLGALADVYRNETGNFHDLRARILDAAMNEIAAMGER